MRTKNKKVKHFIEDLIRVYEKHGMSLTHKDKGGSFIIEDLKKDNLDWLYWSFEELDS